MMKYIERYYNVFSDTLLNALAQSGIYCVWTITITWIDALHIYRSNAFIVTIS